MQYDYMDALKHDIRHFLSTDGKDIPWPLIGDDAAEDEWIDQVEANCYNRKDVTGGDEYYGTAKECYDYLDGNLSLLFTAAKDWQYSLADVAVDEVFQSFDRLIRRYLLDYAAYEVLNDYEKTLGGKDVDD